jgi:hypothetical protein
MEMHVSYLLESLSHNLHLFMQLQAHENKCVRILQRDEIV